MNEKQAEWALDPEVVERAAAAIKPLFRHGGMSGAWGVSLGWNADEEGYGLWEHETDEWFPGQTFHGFSARRASELAPDYFAERILHASGLPAERAECRERAAKAEAERDGLWAHLNSATRITPLGARGSAGRAVVAAVSR